MKRACVLLATIFALALCAFAQQQAQSQPSVAEAARKAREQKKNEKKVASNRVYTNDNLPSGDTLSTSSPAGGAAAADTDKTAGTAEGDTANGEKPATEEEKRAKLEKEWREKIAAQKKKIADTQREVDRISREMNMMGTIAAMGDMGCIQVPQKCADARDAYQKELDQKKKDLESETQKLDDMREDLRRAGLPGSWGD